MKVSADIKDLDFEEGLDDDVESFQKIKRKKPVKKKSSKKTKRWSLDDDDGWN